MHIKVTVHDSSFDVPVGQGNQTIKWLALVAAERYAQKRPHGRARAREETRQRQGFFMPQTITAGAGGLASLDPDARINAVLEDGAAIDVTLQQTVETDDVGAPVLSEWAAAAFCHSEAAERRAAGAESREAQSRAERARERQLRERDARRLLADSTVIVGKLESADDARAALELDWAATGAEQLEPSAEERASIRELLLEHYPRVNACFMHYCGLGRPGDVFGMAFAEFGHFVHLCGIAHWRDERKRIHSAFVGATRKRLSNPEAVRLLSRAEFAGALLRLALDAKQGEPSLVKLEDLFARRVLPFCLEREHDAIFVAFDGAEVQDMIHNARVHLRRVFAHYASAEASDERGESGNVSIDGFRRALLDSGLLALTLTEDNAEERINKVTDHAFLTAQGDPPVHLELLELVFAEFLYAACRVAVEMLDGDSVVRKMQLGLDALLELSLNV